MGDMPTANGPCTGLSAAFEFSSAPVYVYPETVECDRCGNGTCENFESCETCLVDCCPNCGDGVCDFFPPTELAVALTGSGFSSQKIEVLVGDTIRFENELDSSVHLVCDGLMDIVLLEPGSSYEAVPLESGTFSCRLLEDDGKYTTVEVEITQAKPAKAVPGTVRTAAESHLRRKGVTRPLKPAKVCRPLARFAETYRRHKEQNP